MEGTAASSALGWGGTWKDGVRRHIERTLLRNLGRELVIVRSWKDLAEELKDEQSDDKLSRLTKPDNKKMAEERRDTSTGFSGAADEQIKEEERRTDRQASRRRGKALALAVQSPRRAV